MDRRMIDAEHRQMDGSHMQDRKIYDRNIRTGVTPEFSDSDRVSPDVSRTLFVAHTQV